MDWLENNKSEGTWKEPVKAQFEVIFWDLPGKTEEDHRTVISGFHYDVDICGLLGHYAASIGKTLPTFRPHLQR
jgi:hypothetical protein